ncbi:hypothetical protein LTR28_013607, partial [Elasticomyces elasticus]
MAAVVPSSGISLHGASNVGTHGLEHTTASRTAILVSLTESLVGKLRQCADAQKKIQVVTGKEPVLRFRDHTLKLAVAPETFRHELYSSRQPGSSDDLTFDALIKHHIDVRQIVKEATQETKGTDAALTALKNSLASIAQAKESRQCVAYHPTYPSLSLTHGQVHHHYRDLAGSEQQEGLNKAAAFPEESGPSRRSREQVSLGQSFSR